MTALGWTLVGALSLVVLAAAALLVVLLRRLARMEARLNAQSDAESHTVPPRPEPGTEVTARPDEREYVITHLGVADPDGEAVVSAVPMVPAPVFADIVLRESVVRGAALAHGVRRALSARNRNRIRFEFRQEVKRSRRQRRADLRTARREYEARQRAAA
jgi:hypothetical protein